MAAGILDYLPQKIAEIIGKLKEWQREEVIEIRMRVHQPLQLISLHGEIFPLDGKNKPCIITPLDLERAFMILVKNSYYALERQLAEGFLTIPGGHRVGFTGQAVLEDGNLRTIKNINSLNYRISRQVIGVAGGLLDKILDREEEHILNTLIIGPPLCGKTTLLRDLVRLISDGDERSGLKGKKVALVDERSEIAGAYKGIPQNRIGMRTDLLDNCPKARGMLLLIRAMSPEVVAVDEIGSREDVLAIEEVINAGVKLLCTIHGRDYDSILRRPSLKELLAGKAFARYIVLSNKAGIGTVERILDASGREVGRGG
ncbi:MAG: stage III sporulation protein AA [Halanaerobiaceae bacterium]|nr:stage III sporulation protein AA [Halanaerobiaceae bacterium]